MSSNTYTESWLTGPQSTKFYTRTYAPASSPRAVIVFIHGFAEHIGRYTHFHPLFAERGIAIFTFDQRGFGRTAQDVEEKSKNSAYGKTSWQDQMGDIAWALAHAKEEFPGLPVFLMGHSMGGGEVSGFASQGEKAPYYATLSSLAGIIATSPLIKQTTPSPKFLRWIGEKASGLAPYTLIPADVVAGSLSHDSAFNDAYLSDPLIKQSGSLRGISDMLSHGDALLETSYKNWPETLPALFIHGTEDKVTSYKATQSFLDKIPAKDKKFVEFPGGFHELQNEPDGVKEKLAEEVITFVDAHSPTDPASSPSKL